MDALELTRTSSWRATRQGGIWDRQMLEEGTSTDSTSKEYVSIAGGIGGLHGGVHNCRTLY